METHGKAAQRSSQVKLVGTKARKQATEANSEEIMSKFELAAGKIKWLRPKTMAKHKLIFPISCSRGKVHSLFTFVSVAGVFQLDGIGCGCGCGMWFSFQLFARIISAR